MNKEQIDRVNNWTEPKEFLAENGYRLDEADPDKDTAIIHKRWRYGKPGYEHETELRLKHWPAVCVRFNRAAEPVSHEMLSYLGQLTAQFTVEEHRCKGLGTIVERALAKRVIKAEMIPFKEVEHYNASVYKRSCADEFWTLLRDEQGNEEAIVYLSISDQKPNHSSS
ncbi:hypothetical protein WR25_25903 [Diploscapter pachys]|uniref:Glycine N-acyltransferase-like protein n=1 Tax=Diploscapter pachys TaxID=2018661 RepID=A0A2A2J1Y8_9BILA|nr:hypothetical protein WR25_25903 [Diploscapter pachys]